MAEFVNHIFEHPECGEPDAYHPWDHAAYNIGAAAFNNSIGLSGMPVPLVLGVTYIDGLAMALAYPQWARLVVASASDHGQRVMDEHSREMQEMFPLSPIDLWGDYVAKP